MPDRNHALDGLRAVACLLVLAHHLLVPGASGGWLGVDVFFVLSGYLITGNLLRERDRTGGISLRKFYLRRAARLYPALLALIAGCAAVVAATGASLTDYGQNAALALAYLTDVTWLHAPPMPWLGHTWSLAVEEQFYLLWPLALVALRTRRQVAVAASVAGAASVAVMLMTDARVESLPASYVLPHARAWELLAGSLLAAATLRIPHRWAMAGQAAGLVLIAAAVAVAASIGRSTTGTLAASCVVAVAGALLVVASATAPGLLGGRALRLVGRRSYGLYLYHVPIIAIVGVTGARWVVRTAVALALTAVLTWASWRWVEEPCQRWAHRRGESLGQPGNPSRASTALSTAARRPATVVAALIAASASTSRSGAAATTARGPGARSSAPPAS